MHKYLGLHSTVRASFYLYNTREDWRSLDRSYLKSKGVF
ncbi:hypothetical protein [Streptococcus equi]